MAIFLRQNTVLKSEHHKLNFDLSTLDREKYMILSFSPSSFQHKYIKLNKNYINRYIKRHEYKGSKVINYDFQVSF